ncbi:MAG TPA: VWA domain-containing protein [Candidatus Hydrogenedentes bacterium]|nr:VWA domain-containing protein [Candidatus Hydrogenedentota bacterium]HIJ74972.1 VWA domain-containing protein [Candidatus Hydrogenedentota bacterium]
MNTIEFAFPLRQLHWWLAVAIVVLGAIILGLRALEKRHAKRLERFVAGHLASRLLHGYDASVRRPLFWFTVAGCAALVLTFAQPKWGRTWQEVARPSRDIIICLDTSESMRAENPLPNRLERAKQKIFSLLDRAPADRFGLVVFAGAAELQCPLTLDHGYFKAVLNAVTTDTISIEGTDIAAALHEAARTVREEAEETGVFNKDLRAALLISDGEQVSGDAIKEAEKTADYARVYVIGVGDPHGTEVAATLMSSRRGRAAEKSYVHVSKLDEDTLIRVARAGDGGYVRSTPDNSDIMQIHEHLEKLARHTVSSDVRLRLVNRYQWPLAFVILCFLAEGFWLAALPWFRDWRTRVRADGGRQHA